jgi:GR25 family glycosyltransferase involved in LPS biosynthesis
MIDPKVFFDWCAVISLKRTPQRLESFRDRIKTCNWPFRDVVEGEAIDGKLCEPAPWWHCGPGAWGAYRSHLNTIEYALNCGFKCILVMEDDAQFIEGFAEKSVAFLESLPANWELAYLGGQTNHANQNIERINDLVARPQSVNRLHCYALSRIGMTKVYRHLCRLNWNLGDRIEENGVVRWQGAHHVDHHIERLSRDRQIATYCPHEWLVNQSSSFSEITNRHMPERSFSGAPQQAVFAVVGPYSGGTSAVAGAMHNLGISMGQKFIVGDRQHTPKGNFEAAMLFKLCKAAYDEGHGFKELAGYSQRVDMLRKWKEGRKTHGNFIGAKHPKLCLMIPEMREAWPKVKFIVVHRPLEKSIASLRKEGWFSMPADKVVNWFVETRDRDLHDVPQADQLHVDYEQLCDSPETSLKVLAKFCGIEPKPEHYERAIAFVDGSLNHHRDEDQGEPIAAVRQESNACRTGTCGCKA